MIKPYTIQIKSIHGEEFGVIDVSDIYFINKQLKFISVLFNEKICMFYDPDKNIFYNMNGNLIGYNLTNDNTKDAI